MTSGDSGVAVVNGIVIEPERCSDADAVDEVVRRAFRNHRGVAEMVAVIRAWPGYRRGLAFVARADARVVGFRDGRRHSAPNPAF